MDARFPTAHAFASFAAFAAFVLFAGACSSESDGRNVVMVEPDEETGGSEQTGLSDRPASRTIGGTTTQPGQLTPWESEAQQSSEDLITQDQYLDRLLAARDCNQVGDLRDQICDLAGRICEIAEAHPESGRTREQCEDASARCTRAGERVAEDCQY